MHFPVTEAEPTELVFALTAGHMVASLVLLDRPSAIRALLRVLLYPFSEFVIVQLFFVPHFHLATVRRLMGLSAAYGAVCFTAFTFNGVYVCRR